MATEDPSGAPAPPESPAAAALPAQSPARVDLNLADPTVDDDLEGVASQLAAGRREARAEGVPIAERPYDPLMGTRPYNPDEFRDATRQTITLWLIGLLCAIVTLTFVSLLAKGLGLVGSSTFFDDLKKVLDVLVGPVITLLASAVGFYFGSKQAESGASAAKPPTS